MEAGLIFFYVLGNWTPILTVWKNTRTFYIKMG